MRLFFLQIVSVGLLLAFDLVVDDQTGLIWQDNGKAKTIKRDWVGAKAYCRNLSFAGYSDWRLPDIKELQSIVDIKRHKPAIAESFKSVASNHYWSSTKTVPDSTNAWYVQFENGFTFVDCKLKKRYVRCVRGDNKM